MSDPVELVADALIAEFKAIIAEHSGESFEATGVALPPRKGWLRYANVAVESLKNMHGK